MLLTWQVKYAFIIYIKGVGVKIRSGSVMVSTNKQDNKYNIYAYNFGGISKAEIILDVTNLNKKELPDLFIKTSNEIKLNIAEISIANSLPVLKKYSQAIEVPDIVLHTPCISFNYNSSIVLDEINNIENINDIEEIKLIMANL